MGKDDWGELGGRDGVSIEERGTDDGITFTGDDGADGLRDFGL
jgi:hypothetical protein